VLGIVGVALSTAAVLIASGVFERDSNDSGSPRPIAAAEPSRDVPIAPATAASPATQPAASGSLPAASTAPVVLDLRSDPDHADILVDGDYVGKTPHQYEVPRGYQPLSVEFRRNGFRPETRDVVPDDSKKVAVSLDRIADHKAPPPRPASKSGKTGGKTGKTTGSGKTSPPPEKPPVKPPVKFVP
jgi:hypothetical protein